jgi:hypothetical protein
MRIALALMAGPAMLVGCAMPDTKGLIQMPGSRIGLQQLPDASGYEVVVGEATRLPMPGQLNARIDAMWTVGGHRLVLIDGAAKGDVSGRPCPSRPHLLVARETQASIRALGKCDDRFTFTWAADQWTARQVNARDPMVWNFRDGVLSGPVAQSSLTRRGRGSLPERAPEAPAGEMAGRDGAGAASPAVPAEMGRDPAAPPPESQPVGEDVIPPPVGGGPLPRQSPRPPRLF